MGAAGAACTHRASSGRLQEQEQQDAPAADQLSARAKVTARVAEFNARVREWASSDWGQGMIVAWRWAVPTQDTLTELMRGEIRPYQRAGVVQIRQACAPLGIPVQEDGIFVWAKDAPSWLEAREARQNVCSCVDLPPVLRLSICALCGGARTAAEVGGVVTGVCRWCQGF